MTAAPEPSPAKNDSAVTSSADGGERTIVNASVTARIASPLIPTTAIHFVVTSRPKTRPAISAAMNSGHVAKPVARTLNPARRSRMRMNDCVKAAKHALPVIVAMMPTSASDVDRPRTGTSACGRKFSPTMSATKSTTPSATGIVAARSFQSCPASPPAPMKIAMAAQPETMCANQSGLARGSDAGRSARVATARPIVTSDTTTSAAKIARQACGAATNAPTTGPSAAAPNKLGTSTAAELPKRLPPKPVTSGGSMTMKRFPAANP